MSEDKATFYSDRDLLIRIDSWRESFDREIRAAIKEVKEDQKAMRSEFEALKRQQDQARGGLMFGKWLVGAIASLPFLGGLAGWVLSERGGP